MPGGGGSGSTTTVQKSDPWEKQQPYLEQVFSGAGNIYDQGVAPMYPGSFTAQKTLPSALAEELTLGRALGGSPALSAGRDLYTDTLSGQYLDPTRDPRFQVGLDRVTEQYQTGIAPQTDAAFSRAGAYGGSAWQDKTERNQKALSEGLNRVNADVYGRERQNQLSALQLLPGMNQLDYGEIGKISAVGSQRDARNQALLDEARQRFDYTEGGQGEKQNLQDFSNFIQGTYGSTKTSTEPYSQNQGAGILGGALSGASLGAAAAPGISMATGIGLPWLAGPWGAGIGAGLGILGSFL